jgi:nucleoside-diphosphate-sugar epimerase
LLQKEERSAADPSSTILVVPSYHLASGYSGAARGKAPGMNDVHVVFGTGAVGLALVDELAAQGLTVRAVNRSGHAEVPGGVEVVAGDVADLDAAARAAKGAAVVYQCLSPPYHRWADLFPPMQRAVVHAAQAADARYVSFENTYMYGDTQGAPISESTPLDAHTRKGKVRLAMAEELRRLHEAGDLVVTTARASDYFGPRGTSQSPLGDLVIGAALAGKPARVVGDPDQPHSYTYLLDAARTLAALGTRDDVAGEVFHVPNAPAKTTRRIVEMIAGQLGSPIKISVAPRLVLRLVGLFNPTVRELDEMRYEFTQPFVVDGTKAEAELDVAPTPLDEALAQTIAWFRR